MQKKPVVALSAGVVAVVLAQLGACSPQIHDASGGAGGANGGVGGATDTTPIITSTTTTEVGGGLTTTETPTGTTTTTITTTSTTITSTTTTTATTSPTADCGDLPMQITEPCRDCAVTHCCNDLKACDIGTDCYNHLSCLEQGISKAQCDSMYSHGKAPNAALVNCLDASCPGACAMN